MADPMGASTQAEDVADGTIIEVQTLEVVDMEEITNHVARPMSDPMMSQEHNARTAKT